MAAELQVDTMEERASQLASQLIVNLTSSAILNATQALFGEPTKANNISGSSSVPKALEEAASSLLFGSSEASNNDDRAAPTKLIASLVLFLVTLLCGYVPVRLILNQNYIQHAMFAGGGVLMATAFCHLIPEAHDNFRQANSGAASDEHKHAHGHAHTHTHTHTTAAAPGEQQASLAGLKWDHLTVPYPEMTLCCGFFFMYLVEQLMVRFINNHTHEHPCDSDTRASSTGQLTCVGYAPGGACGGGGGGGLSDSNMIGQLGQSVRSNSFDLGVTDANSRATELYKFLRGLLIVSAFGAHSIFDGVAIGSQETPQEVWTIFFAISCHKLIIAAVVGLDLFAATLESHLWTLVHLAIFSLMSPLGIILVVVAQNSLEISSGDPAMILLQSFASGTLLYIIFVEILQPKEEQAYERHRFGKSLSMIAGFALMLVVLTFVGH